MLAAARRPDCPSTIVAPSRRADAPAPVAMSTR